MTDSTNSALEELQQSMGLKDTIELLEFALPRIEKRCDELKRHLLAEDWDSAARVAHQTISSAHVYSSSRFEQKLQQINQKNIEIIGTVSFQQDLTEECEAIIQSIKAWLVNH